MTVEKDDLRIIGVKVEDLFNTKNYDIDFNEDPNVTIIYGLNGTGKTTILRMIHNILSLNFISLEKNNFKSFTLKLKNGSFIEYKKGDKPEKSEVILFSKSSKRKWKPIDLQIIKRISRSYKKKPFDYISFYNYLIHTDLAEKFIELFKNNNYDEIYDLILELRKINKEYYIYTKELSPHEVFSLFELFFEKKKIPISQWFYDVIKFNPLLYIESERLVQYKKFDKRRFSKYSIPSDELEPERVISIFSRQLQEIKDEFIGNYNEISQTLNRTFPKRVVDILKTEKEKFPTSSVLEKQIEEIRQLEEELISFGLVTKKEKEIAEINKENLEISEIAKSISLWVDDTNKKHLQFKDLMNKLRLFRDVVNNHLNEKDIMFDSNDGFYFFTNLDEKLSSDKLSSGEQHIVVLSYNLIFKAEKNALVLIDEPEISLHSIWQNNFVDDIIKMGKEKSLYFLIATHSSEIINGRFGLIRRLEKIESS